MFSNKIEKKNLSSTYICFVEISTLKLRLPPSRYELVLEIDVNSYEGKLRLVLLTCFMAISSESQKIDKKKCWNDLSPLCNSKDKNTT